MNLDIFFKAFVEAALWSTNDESTPQGGVPLDKNHDTIEPVSAENLKKECAEFIRLNVKLLEGMDAGQCGHDFWLTRNHHGAGFWDRGYHKHIGDGLTDGSHAFGEVHLYVVDGQIYAAGYEEEKS